MDNYQVKFRQCSKEHILHFGEELLHANMNLISFVFHVPCSDSILRSYNFSVLSVLPIYSKLIKAGLRVWLYRCISAPCAITPFFSCHVHSEQNLFVTDPCTDLPPEILDVTLYTILLFSDTLNLLE
jgi:hypothetical protein